MQTNKEKIYSIVELRDSGSNRNGVTTEFLAQSTGIKRPNVSALLNELVSEGKLIKSGGRPVRYMLPHASSDEPKDCFSNLVGHDGSLLRAVQLVKAAVLYPQKSLDMLIVGAFGTGKTLFVQLIYRFAINNRVVAGEAPLISVDCDNYRDNEEAVFDLLFGSQSETKGYYAAARGVLAVENIDRLSDRAQSTLLKELDFCRSRPNAPITVLTSNDSSAYISELTRVVPLTVRLPSLNERPLSERFSLIQAFLVLESARIKRPIHISADLLRCLLLYECELNLFQLKTDIKVACATAYVRERENQNELFNLYIGDFEHYVRSGFLEYGDRRAEIERIIPYNYNYTFNSSMMEMSELDRRKLLSGSIYDILDRRADELKRLGVAEKNMSAVLASEIVATYSLHESASEQTPVDRDRMSKLVKPEIVDLVDNFLKSASVRFERTFSTSRFLGLCFHLDAFMHGRGDLAGINPEKLAVIQDEHPDEFTFCARFAHKLESVLSLPLPATEIATLTLFVCQEQMPQSSQIKVAVIFAFFGKGVARSISDSVGAFTGDGRVYCFEALYESNVADIRKELHELIRHADRGGGCIVFYDMDVLGEIINDIAAENASLIRSVRIPIQTTGLEAVRRASAGESAEEIFLGITNSRPRPLNNVIVTICTTGEGGAQTLSDYINQFGNIKDTEIIPLAMSDPAMLKRRLSEIRENNTIMCIVGVNDPKLFGLRFVSISDLLSCDKADLPRLLKLGPNFGRPLVDYTEIYEYLDEQLERLDVAKLRQTLPTVIARIKKELCELSLDSEIGLFVHLASCINRLLGSERVQANPRRELLYEKYESQFREITSILRPLERSFGIIIPDDEIANIITIIYKL